MVQQRLPSFDGGRSGRRFILTLAAGMIFGFLSACLLITSTRSVPHMFNWLPGGSIQLRDPHHYSELEREIGPETEVKFHGEDEDFHRGEDKIARDLAKRVRVLCWIMTGPKNHQTKARHVKATWGKRCNILLFMSSAEDASLPTVVLPVKEGRDNLWAKTKEAFKYAYEKYKDEADWFIKADDDTYVVVENLRYMLSSYNPNSPLYFGCRFKPFVKQGYMSGGAGYVLSKEGLRSAVRPHVLRWNAPARTPTTIGVDIYQQPTDTIVSSGAQRLGHGLFGPSARSAGALTTGCGWGPVRNCGGSEPRWSLWIYYTKYLNHIDV